MNGAALGCISIMVVGGPCRISALLPFIDAGSYRASINSSPDRREPNVHDSCVWLILKNCRLIVEANRRLWEMGALSAISRKYFKHGHDSGCQSMVFWLCKYRAMSRRARIFPGRSVSPPPSLDVEKKIPPGGRSSLSKRNMQNATIWPGPLLTFLLTRRQNGCGDVALRDWP